jgi:chromosomal replication initiator protein
MQRSAESLEAWNRAVEHIRRRSPATFEQWFSNVQFDKLENGVLELTARNDFVRDWVKVHFLPTLVTQLQQALGNGRAEGVRVKWRIAQLLPRPICPPGLTAPVADAENPEPSPSSHRQVRPRSELVAPQRASRATISAGLNPKHTFKNFVVGPSNELAHAAAFAAAGGGGRRYNPLFLAGRTGLGKTHLMHAIAHKVFADRPQSRIVYVSAEHFTNEFIQALQNHRMEEFRTRYRGECDLLLLDDIQFLAGREQTQEEFFHTFNALRDLDRQIVVTADKYPQQLQRMPERLVSRFTSGLVADIQVPQLETRVAIVRKKAELEGISVSDEVAVFLAQHVQSNVRELEGALIRLAAKASLTGQPIDLDFARREMTTLPGHGPELVSVEDIQRAVCGHFRLSSSELLSKDRHKSVAFARQVAMYLCRQRLKCSFPELGRQFGNRDHTTVMSAVRRIEAQAEKDPEVKAHLEAIEHRLASSGD